MMTRKLIILSLQGMYGYGDEPLEDYPGGFPTEDDEFSRQNMMRDISDQRAGLRNEITYGNKRFKLYEKKALNHKKATLFCKKREGKLAEGESIISLEQFRRRVLCIPQSGTFT